MSVLVTAFGPFGGRSENASSLALLALRKSCPDIHTRILPVDAVLAPSRLRHAIRKIRPSALIMLGEAASSTGIRLETRAGNEKNFTIPDIAGRRPMGVSIQKGAADFLESTLPLTAMRERLEKLGYRVSLSDDAGRYLCNQLFFCALDFLKLEKMGIPAGFIHLPLEQDLPTEIAAKVIEELIRIVC